MDNQQLIYNYQFEIKKCNNVIGAYRQQINNINQVLHDKENEYNSTKSILNDIKEDLEKRKNATKNISFMFPNTKCVSFFGNIMGEYINFESIKLVDSIEDEILKMKQEILNDYEKIENIEVDIRKLQKKIVFYQNEIRKLRSAL